MAASQNDLFKKVAASTVTTLSAPGKALGATSLNVGSTTNYPIDTGIIIAIRVVDTSGNLVAGTYTEWSATVTSGTSLAINAIPVYGSDQIYSSGSTTQVFIPLSSYARNALVDGILSQHKQTGTHSNITADSIVVADGGTIENDTVNEATTDNGVTIDGLNIKDGKITTDKAVGLPEIDGGTTRGTLITDASGNVTSSAATAGRVVLGNMQILWGTQTSGTIGTAAYSEASNVISFSNAFSAAPVVTATMSDIGGTVGEYLAVSASSTSSATIICGHTNTAGATSTPTIRWMAIGLIA